MFAASLYVGTTKHTQGLVIRDSFKVRTSAQAYTPGAAWATAALVLAVIVYLVPDLATRGLALDGLVYANIAKALAAGEGGFWALPYYTEGVSAWYDHPPLGVALQGLWFWLAGSSFWVEKVWSLVMMLTSISLIACCWRGAVGEDGWLESVWWPLLLLFVMPIATYTFKNNYLENTLLVFVLSALLAARAAIRTPAWLAVTVLATIMAVLTKGLVGLMPLAAPAIFGWRYGRTLRGITMSAAAAVSLALIIGTLTLIPDVSRALGAYWHTQVVASLSGEHFIVHGRGYLLTHLATNLLPPLLLVVLARWRNAPSTHLTEAGAWLMLTLCAALPLLLSPRQFRHYLLPTLPLLAIGLGLLCTPRLPALPYRGAAVALLVSAFVYAGSIWGRIGDDAKEIAAANHIAETLQTRNAAFCPETPAFQLKAYLFRYHDRTSHPPGPKERWVVCAQQPAPHFDSAADLRDGTFLWRNAQRSPTTSETAIP
ncbi:MAG: glycosyltransferase family 39 protein [Pseudomonadales bacterium]|jgi:hypothetical protein|nr:glycosyltransferase family 39 protein [Pseudomonadales bacterium]MDP6471872.1 glycosyltransferase family 39 protein [Pseudomonadales bacterium]MDP6826858.1 glycosyltransferase family 39 protein [Pseudomonadales bacterium]MDP6970864.1 glycosyltransferase family 39 protein [Pseudomonadales bacterium]|tara:strand:+ start:540 stop:1994 length:1455 start_codon:yes stop_codon:yes gene_type:complete